MSFGGRSFGLEAEGFAAVDHAAKLTSDLGRELLEFLCVSRREVAAGLRRIEPVEGFLKLSVGIR